MAREQNYRILVVMRKNREGKQKIHDDILWIYLLNIDFLLAFCENSGILCWKDWKKYLGDSKELRTK